MSLLLLAALAFAGTPASVVRSREWKAVRSPSRADEFIGDVRYKSGPTLMTSDWARYEHETGRWSARGGVHVERLLKDGATAVADGERAAYDEKTRAGSVLPAPGKLLSFERRTPDAGTDYAEARRLEWRDENDAELVGDVRVWGPRWRAWADRADYRSKVVTLSGSRPVLERVSGEDFIGALKADTVTADDGRKTITARGDVVGWLRWFKKP